MGHTCTVRWEKRWMDGRSHEEWRVLCTKCSWQDKAATKHEAHMYGQQHTERPNR